MTSQHFQRKELEFFQLVVIPLKLSSLVLIVAYQALAKKPFNHIKKTNISVKVTTHAAWNRIPGTPAHRYSLLCTMLASFLHFDFS